MTDTRSNLITGQEMVDEVEELLEKIRFGEGDTIYDQEQPVSFFYLVHRGLLGLYRVGSTGKKVLVEKIGNGETAGVTDLLIGETYPGNLKVLKETIAYRGDQDDLNELRKEHPEWLIELLLREEEHHRSIFQTVEGLLDGELSQQVARELIDLGERVGRKDSEEIEIVIKTTRKDISDMVGCRPETATRILSQWEKQGVISTDHKHITIKKPKALISIAER